MPTEVACGMAGGGVHGGYGHFRNVTGALWAESRLKTEDEDDPERLRGRDPIDDVFLAHQVQSKGREQYECGGAKTRPVGEGHPMSTSTPGTCLTRIHRIGARKVGVVWVWMCGCGVSWMDGGVRYEYCIVDARGENTPLLP